MLLKVAMLLRDDKEANARILVEHIIREDYTLESYEVGQPRIERNSQHAALAHGRRHCAAWRAGHYTLDEHPTRACVAQSCCETSSTLHMCHATSPDVRSFSSSIRKCSSLVSMF